MYDFQRKHGHDIDCHVLAPASTCSNKRASTCSTTRASTCITTCASMVLNGASTCSNTCASTCITTRASTCITTRASTCHYTRARLLFKNMRPGGGNFSCSLAPLRVTFPSIYFVPLMLPPKIYTFWTEHLRDYSGLRVTRNAGNSVFLARSPRFTVFLAPKARKSRHFLHRDKSA